MLRTLVERLSRGRSLRRHMTIAGRSIPIIVSPDAQLKYLLPGSRAFDRDLIDLAESELSATSIVWDVGANIGSFAAAAAAVATAGSVLAIEADIWLAGLVRRTARERAYGGRIAVLPCAVSDRLGVARFLIADRGRASNALASVGGRSQMGGVREEVVVPTLTLDALLEQFPHPTFVKIDVEGAELDVLRGAGHLLETVRPRFYIEIGDEVADAIYRLFQAAGYRAIDPVTRRPIERCAYNTLFVPD